MWRSVTSKSSSLATHLFQRKLLSLASFSTYQVLLHKTLISPSCNGGFSDQTLVVSSSQEFGFAHDFDDGNNDTHVGSFSSIGQEFERVNPNGRFSDQTIVVSSSQGFGLTHDFDGIDGNNDTHVSSFSSIGQELEGVDPNGRFDVERLELVLSLLQNSVDEDLEARLDGLDLGLSEEFVVRVVENPVVNRESLIRFCKWVLDKEQYQMTRSVLGSVASGVCKNPRKKDVYALWDLVKEINEKEKGIVDVEILNGMISAFFSVFKGKGALKVFSKFVEFGCMPNEDTYYLTIKALCRRSFYDWAMPICQKMLDSGMLPDSEKIGEIISYFCKGRREKEAHVVYLVANENNKCPPKRAVSFLIGCLAKEDDTVDLALDLLDDFRGEEARKSAIVPFSAVVRGLCRRKDTKGAKTLLLEMIEKGPCPGNAVFNSVINCLSKSGDLVGAKEMVKLMESRGLKPDVYTYSVIMSGYAKAGSMEEACKVLAEAKRKHQKLCPVTFHTLIRGYCKLGEFDKALKLFSEMEEYGVEPNIDEYNKLIQTFCLKALDWETAEKLVDEMQGKGLHPSGNTRSLIRAVKELEQAAIANA